MPAKAINTLFLTILCMLIMPLAQAHPGHPPTGDDHMLLVLATGLLSAMVLLLTIGIALWRMSVSRDSGSMERN
jgi:hydrogenase/urease accessory protein HupE